MGQLIENPIVFGALKYTSYEKSDQMSGVLFNKRDGYITARSREVSQPRDSDLAFSDRSERQALQQQCCLVPCQVSVLWWKYKRFILQLALKYY